jgi:L-alanine-DL-glutamate epimerase-like enolase superfamily enzyme
MRITRIEAWSVELKLTEPYTIAYETVESTTNVFVRLHTDGKHVGHGCAAPDPHITGETPAEVLEAMSDTAPAALVGFDPVHLVQVILRLRDVVGARRSAVAALDMAVHDLHAQVLGVPLSRLLGAAGRPCMRTSVTIGILDEAATVEAARRWVGAGFCALKLKGGLDVESDITRVWKVREVVGRDIELSFDANQGYSPAQAVAWVKGCAGAGLAYLEQPTQKQSPALLGEVQQQSPIPVMADESVATLDDAEALAPRGWAQLINVKLQKVGGLGAAREIDEVGARHGVGLMVGCLDECALSVAAGLHFALARPNVRFADLDSHLTIDGDPTAEAVTVRDGLLYPADGPGLGVALP